jgi:hypothetical protein
VKEVQRTAIVIRVKIDSLVEQYLEHRTHFPFRQRNARRPEIGATAQCLGRGPEAKLARPRLINGGLGHRPRK